MSRHRDREALLGCDSLLPGAAVAAASPAMRAFCSLLAHTARHDVPVLFLGESGTGKTTFARALHAMSSRARHPFVRVDCSAGSGDLIAYADEARAGTLFLDEVAALTPAAQGSALRLLEDGSRVASPPAVRLVAATGHDLDKAMAAGRFRRDLYYRLSVIEIRIPPLRERREDISSIARTFLATLASSERRRPAADLSPELERALVAYSWPGNVSELFSVLERMLIVSHGNLLDASALPERFTEKTLFTAHPGLGRTDS